MKIIPAKPEHMAACEAIYGHHVRQGFASFDTDPPPPGSFEGKRLALTAAGHAFLVLVDEREAVLGYAYAAPFRARKAYETSIEHSIYLHPEHSGKGFAQQLFEALIAAVRAWGGRTMVAVVGMEQDQDPETHPSIRAHRKAGFIYQGALPFVGQKRGRCLKTAYLTLDLSKDPN